MDLFASARALAIPTPGSIRAATIRGAVLYSIAPQGEVLPVADLNSTTPRARDISPGSGMWPLENQEAGTSANS